MHPRDRFIKWASSWACHGRHSNVHSSLAKKASRIPNAMGRQTKEGSWQREHDLYGKGGSKIYLWAYPKDKLCVNTQICCTKVPFMDSLLNEIISRLKGKGSSYVFCSGCTAFSSPKCTGLESTSLQAPGPGSWKAFALRLKVTCTALLLAFHCSHSSLEWQSQALYLTLYYLGQFVETILKKQQQHTQKTLVPGRMPCLVFSMVKPP